MKQVKLIRVFTNRFNEKQIDLDVDGEIKIFCIPCGIRQDINKLIDKIKTGEIKC